MRQFLRPLLRGLARLLFRVDVQLRRLIFRTSACSLSPITSPFSMAC
jgi:hypothetical protein